LLLSKNSFVNISRTCVFALVFNTYTKDFTISAIKNIKCASTYINNFIVNKDNNNKKEAISFCVIAFITSIIKKCRDCILFLRFENLLFSLARTLAILIKILRRVNIFKNKILNT